MPSLGQRGVGGILAIPGKRFGAPQPNAANKTAVSSQPFRSAKGCYSRLLFGVSETNVGAVLPLATVIILRTPDNSLVGTTISDANGNWAYVVTGDGPFFLVEYKTGTPDVAGTSLNTLMPYGG